MPTVLPLTGSLLKQYNSLPAIPPKDPLGDIINQLNAGGGGAAIGSAIPGGTPGSVLFIGAGPVLAQDNVAFFWDDLAKRLGIGTATPSADLSFGGAAARVAGVERQPVANTAGNRLSVNAGGATAGATDKAGGNLVLSAGVSTGAASGNINLQTPILGAAGVVDNALQTGLFVEGGAAGSAKVYVNATSSNPGSNAGLQINGLVANRGSLRTNQWGNNAGVPGMTGFKSRGAAIGTLLRVADGDTLFRATAIGVGGDDAFLGLSGWLGIDVPVGGVIPGNAACVATDFAVELSPLGGVGNSHRPAFKVDSECILHIRESTNSMAGIAVIGAGGNIVVANTRVTATTRFQLTAQDGGAVPTGSPFVVARAVGVGFTIQSTAGVADAGVNVYYQLFEPIP